MLNSAHITKMFDTPLDTVGATASVVCAVHCAGVALLLGIAPTLQMFAAPWIDWAFLCTSFVIGVLALIPGFRRHHNPLPLAMFTGGITILFMARLLRLAPSPVELAIVLLAASALITAHWRNSRELRSCRCGADDIHPRTLPSA